MPEPRAVHEPLHGIHLTDTSTGARVDLGSLGGLSVLVLLRHRH